MFQLLKQISSHSLQGAFRLLMLRITGKEYVISGRCNQCGSCCCEINLKTSSGWIRNEQQFKNLIHVHKEYDRFKIIGKDSQGFMQFSCSWLTLSGACCDHQNRLDICIKYPAKSLMFCGGQISADCGYTIEKVTPFSKLLEQERQKLS